jgi:hypothetical protein
MTITIARKKPVEIRMCQYKGDNNKEIVDFVGAGNVSVRAEHILIYDYLHDSWIKVMPQQFVVQGTKGEFYPLDYQQYLDTYDFVRYED